MPNWQHYPAPAGRAEVGVIHELPLQARHGMYRMVHTTKAIRELFVIFFEVLGEMLFLTFRAVAMSDFSFRVVTDININMAPVSMIITNLAA